MLFPSGVTMGIVPKGRGKRISWYRSRVAKWALDPTGIGTSAADVEALQDMIDEAEQSRLAQAQARNAAQAATSRFNSALERMANAGGSIVLQIRSKARTSGSGVYAKASVPKPRKSSPIA